MAMTSSRPYMIRACYEWILDNDSTPYVLVNALADRVEVPLEHVKDGQIILNISPSAVQGLQLRNDALEFEGRFAGIATRVFVPIPGVLGIYAKENGQGMFFEFERPQPDPTTEGSSSSGKAPQAGRRVGKRPPLRVVK